MPAPGQPIARTQAVESGRTKDQGDSDRWLALHLPDLLEQQEAQAHECGIGLSPLRLPTRAPHDYCVPSKASPGCLLGQEKAGLKRC